MESAEFKVSITEFPHFERLVTFLAEVEEHAEREDDYALKGLVDECFADLMRCSIGGEG